MLNLHNYIEQPGQKSKIPVCFHDNQPMIYQKDKEMNFYVPLMPVVFSIRSSSRAQMGMMISLSLFSLLYSDISEQLSVGTLGGWVTTVTSLTAQCGESEGSYGQDFHLTLVGFLTTHK